MITRKKQQSETSRKWRAALIFATAYEILLLAIDAPGFQAGLGTGGAFPHFAESLGNFPVSILAFSFADYLAGLFSIKYTLAHAVIGHICSTAAGAVWWAALWILGTYIFGRLKASAD